MLTPAGCRTETWTTGPRPSMTDSAGVSVAVHIPETAKASRKGLLGRDSLAAGYAMLISSGSIHTFRMRFALDLVWLDRSRRVVRVDEAVPPGRMKFSWRALIGAGVLELKAGEARRLGLETGDELSPELITAASS